MTEVPTSFPRTDSAVLDALRVVFDGRTHGWTHLGTAGRDGAPHVSPVLLIQRDGVLFVQLTGRQKRRNLERDARVSLSSAVDFPDIRHVILWGSVEVRFEPELEPLWRTLMFEALGDGAFAYASGLSATGAALGVVTVERSWLFLPAAAPA